MGKTREYRKIVSVKGRVMWYDTTTKPPQLIAANKVPQDVKEFYADIKEPGDDSAEIKKAKRPLSQEEADQQSGVELEGFQGISLETDPEHPKTVAKEKKAEAVLMREFPEFDFNVDYKPERKREGKKPIKARFIIEITRNDQFVRELVVTDFDMNVIKQNVDSITEGWKSLPRKIRGRRTGVSREGQVESQSRGTRQVNI